jgi:hypothetical protein
MDELNQVLERMRIALEEKNKNTLHMQPHGLTSEGGNLTTAKQPSQPSQNQDGYQQQTHTLPSTHSQQDKNELAKTLAIVCAMQKQYGKTQAELEILVEGFSMILADRPMKQIIEAIKVYVKTNPSIPTPADIENIINPPEQPLSTSMYVKIMKECTVGGKFLYGDKKDFVEAYEAQEMKKVRGGSDALRQAQIEIEQHKQQYLEQYHE